MILYNNTVLCNKITDDIERATFIFFKTTLKPVHFFTQCNHLKKTEADSSVNTEIQLLWVLSSKIRIVSNFLASGNSGTYMYVSIWLQIPEANEKKKSNQKPCKIWDSKSVGFIC